MVYFKMTDDNGFVSASTLNAETGGNSTQAEHDTIVQMYRDAEPGYSVIETDGSFAYAKRPEPPEPEPTVEDKAEAFDILMGVSE